MLQSDEQVESSDSRLLLLLLSKMLLAQDAFKRNAKTELMQSHKIITMGIIESNEHNTSEEY